MAKRSDDPFSLSDTEILNEIRDLHSAGHSAEDITDALLDQYGKTRIDRVDLVSVILHLLNRS
jgi:cytochrome c-type biogenesis protein CcmH/NrfF